jgi:hypothetical protein
METDSTAKQYMRARRHVVVCVCVWGGGVTISSEKLKIVKGHRNGNAIFWEDVCPATKKEKKKEVKVGKM